jgi:hypothetical protein
MSSNARGSNHVQLNPHRSMYLTYLPQMRASTQANGGNAIAAVTVTATTHAPHISSDANGDYSMVPYDDRYHDSPARKTEI